MRRLFALAVIVLGLAAVGCMSVPTGLHVYETNSGCTSDGVCPWGDSGYRQFYYAPTREIVVVVGQPLKVWAHEACHAHQHQAILDETGREPVGLTLAEWQTTDEGVAYAAAIAGWPRPDWYAIANNYSLLEDFAEACGRYLVQDPRFPSDPARDVFFEARDFR